MLYIYKCLVNYTLKYDLNHKKIKNLLKNYEIQ